MGSGYPGTSPREFNISQCFQQLQEIDYPSVDVLFPHSCFPTSGRNGPDPKCLETQIMDVWFLQGSCAELKGLRISYSGPGRDSSQRLGYWIELNRLLSLRHRRGSSRGSSRGCRIQCQLKLGNQEKRGDSYQLGAQCLIALV